MNLTLKITPTRLLAGFGTLALLTSLGLAASRPAHTAGGPVSVSVANVPLPTSDADNPEQKPFQYTLAPSSSTSNSASDGYSVPAGKRAVIEYCSAQLTQYPAGGYGYQYLITTANGQTAYYKVVPPVPSTAPYSQITRIYADPGTPIFALVVSSSGTSCGGNLILSGHFVDVK